MKRWDLTHTTSEATANEGRGLFGYGGAFSGSLLLWKTVNLGEGYCSNFMKHERFPN